MKYIHKKLFSAICVYDKYLSQIIGLHLQILSFKDKISCNIHLIFGCIPTSLLVLLLLQQPNSLIMFVEISSCLGWTKMHEVFKSLLPRYFLKDIYVK